jgi:AraC family transcriptional activator of tynA and feaB
MTLDVWTTSQYRTSDRFDAWRHALNQSHLEWNLDPVPEEPFGARIRQKMLDGLRVVDCYCDPCTGWRRRPQIGRSEEAYFGVLFELRGREVVRQNDHEAVLEAGDFVVWDSEREMEFRVLEPLHKLTLLIPKRRLKMYLSDAERYTGMLIQGSSRADGITAEALRRLANDFAEIDESQANAVVEPILSLLTATLQTRGPPSRAPLGHQDSFRSFCRHIEQNLSDCDLTPSTVAAEHRVSLRYLHMVFAEQGMSFGKFVRQRRLAHCYREISRPKLRATVTEIAFRWGFNDPAHFSRIFKAEFGSSPRAVSKGALASNCGDVEPLDE